MEKFKGFKISHEGIIKIGCCSFRTEDLFGFLGHHLNYDTSAVINYTAYSLDEIDENGCIMWNEGEKNTDHEGTEYYVSPTGFKYIEDDIYVADDEATYYTIKESMELFVYLGELLDCEVIV